MPPSTTEQIQSALRTLGGEDFVSHADLVATAVPRLAALLGYRENEVFFERFLGPTTLRADAIFAASSDAPPWVVVEVKGPMPGKASRSLWEKWQQQVHQYFLAGGQSPTLLLTPHELSVRTGATTLRSELRTVDARFVDALVALLKRPDGPPPESPKHPACASVDEAPIDDTFRMSRRRLCELLQEVRTASRNDSKGKALEVLASELFASTVCAKVKYRRLLTASSEIDLVLEMLSRRVPPSLEHYGRYALVECRNWASPVGAGSLRDFLAKLKATRSKLGILFSSQGVTGSDSGADALREIQRAFDVDDIHVAVVTDQDLQRLVDGRSFLDHLDSALDSLRFNLQ